MGAYISDAHTHTADSLVTSLLVWLGHGAMCGGQLQQQDWQSALWPALISVSHTSSCTSISVHLPSVSLRLRLSGCVLHRHTLANLSTEHKTKRPGWRQCAIISLTQQAWVQIRVCQYQMPTARLSSKNIMIKRLW